MGKSKLSLTDKRKWVKIFRNNRGTTKSQPCHEQQTAATPVSLFRPLAWKCDTYNSRLYTHWYLLNRDGAPCFMCVHRILKSMNVAQGRSTINIQQLELFLFVRCWLNQGAPSQFSHGLFSYSELHKLYPWHKYWKLNLQMLEDLWNQAGEIFITQLYDFHLTLSLLCSHILILLAVQTLSYFMSVEPSLPSSLLTILVCFFLPCLWLKGQL